MKYQFLIHYFCIFLILYSTQFSACQKVDTYKRVSHSCKLMPFQKRRCMIPENKNECCQNCLTSKANCFGETYLNTVFFLIDFIPCPSGVTKCIIQNEAQIFNSWYLKTYFRTESDYEQVKSLIRFEAIECEKTHLLLGQQCVYRGNCKKLELLEGKVKCLECDEGYYYDESDSQNRCKKCQVYVYSQDKIKISKVHCKKCESKDRSCTECINSFFLSKEPKDRLFCKQCKSNCNCSLAQECESCTFNDYYLNINPITGISSCVSCSVLAKKKIGENLASYLSTYNLKISDFILSCTSSHSQVIMKLKSVPVNDIIGQQFKINPFFTINELIDTCKPGCADCFQDKDTLFLQCKVCQNGFFLNKQNSDEKQCESCNSADKDYLLCDIFKTLLSYEVKPTQCETNFLQVPDYAHTIFEAIPKCSIQPSCLIAEEHVNDIIETKGSCKICMAGYHKKKINPELNYYKCFQDDLQDNSLIQNICFKDSYYEKENQTCQKCGQYCLRCNSKNDCLECNSRIAFSRQKINSQFFECIVLTQTSDVLNCEIFGKGYFEEGENKTPKNGFCSECKKEAYPIYTQEDVNAKPVIIACKELLQNCKLLENRFDLTCSLCKLGYYLTSQKKCLPLPQNCALYDPFFEQCVSCEYGYFIFNGECFQSQETNSLDKDGTFLGMNPQQQFLLLKNHLTDNASYSEK